MPRVSFCGQTYSDKTLNANAQRSINWYPMRSPTDQEPNRIIMYPTPGYFLLYDVVASSGITGTGAIRGFFELNGTLYVISGSKLLSVTANSSFTTFTVTALGTLNTSTGRCSIACNTRQLTISDRIYGYTYTLATGAFAGIPTTGSFPAAGGVTNLAFFDSYILAALNGSKRVIQSDVLNATSFGAQAYNEITSFPDNIVGVFSDERQFYIFGPKSGEVQFNAGSTPYALQKQPGTLIQAGVAAIDSVVKAGGTLVWLASDEAGKAYIAALEGYQPKVISTAPINEVFERYETVSDAFAYSYREGANQFYCITFPSVNNGQGATWAVELSTQFWHERSISGGRDLPDQYITWVGRHIVGDATGKLYLMSQDYSVDHTGAGLLRTRTAQHIVNDKVAFLKELEIFIESGVGLISGQGSAPLATLEISRDGGHTWLTLGTASMGLMGQYRRRLLWRALGRVTGTVTFKLTISDPVRSYILGARLEAVAGTK